MLRSWLKNSSKGTTSQPVRILPRLLKMCKVISERGPLLVYKEQSNFVIFDSLALMEVVVESD